MKEPNLYNLNCYGKNTRKAVIKPPIKVYTEDEYEELKNAQKQVHQAFVKKKINFSK